MQTPLRSPHLSQSHSSPETAEAIRVTGIVQGVGFRPTVYRLAQACGLGGEVCNDGEGVLIRVVGTIEAINTFVDRLQAECPPLAQIEAIYRTLLSEIPPYQEFKISHSVRTAIHTGIAPDAATCPQCRVETLDPLSRWYRYPFTNCTHCGPRLSIVKAIPYDRINTSMASFQMCPECAKEYGAVTDRRFHAQPVACPQCGPKVWLVRGENRSIELEQILDRESDPIEATVSLLQQGAILAIKGMGGFHLACDATNETAVQQLRQRKHRYHKPFALMARDLEIIDRYCWINDKEKVLLQSPIAPIVLLSRKQQESASFSLIAPTVALGMTTLGFILPYTPLHYLILHCFDRPIVLTSGNVSDEPQCIDNQTALTKLGTIADYFVLHDREIVNRVDDSVVRVWQKESERDTEETPLMVQVLRRARGYAPAPMPLPPGFEQAPPILAMGSELKNTFCLLQDGKAIVSQHLGDLENAVAFQAYRQTLDLYLRLFAHQPDMIAIDQHPEYLSTKLGKQLAQTSEADISLVSIQHHHAHIAACMAENGIGLNTQPVLGIALDGLGYGEDGTLWGGEFLLADYRSSQRLACFKPIAMLGGEQAIYQPWRNTYAHLMAALNWEDLQTHYGQLELMQFLAQQPRSLLDQLLQKGIHSPLASSAGRLFDAVAAAVGVCRTQASYEGQGAIELEALMDATHLSQVEQDDSAYRFNLVSGFPSILDPSLMWRTLLNDLRDDVPIPLIAARFHVGLAAAIVHLVLQLRDHYLFTQVALTGGVFQNQILTQQVTQKLHRQGLIVLTHSKVPPNDGGISLGQATIAAARSIS